MTEESSLVSISNHNDSPNTMEDQETRKNAEKATDDVECVIPTEDGSLACRTTQEPAPMQLNNCIGEDDELEEGELKDDDDDDDDDDNSGDVVDGLTKTSKLNSDDSDSENKKRSNSSDSRKSSVEDSSNCSSSSSDSGGNDTQKTNFKAHSIRSSSSSIDRVHRPNSFTSRNDSRSRHSSRSHSRTRRLHSPSNNNHQARLVTMRAKLLEAKSREIELKFQKNKVNLTSLSTISTPISTLGGNLKSTVAKPSITYAENPNPSEEISKPIKRSRSVKKSESKDKSRPSKKLSKKRKKKSSSKKKKKRIKTSDSSRKVNTSEKTNSVSTEPSIDNIDRQGPRTPPDNQVLTLDDEQIEWPSYLIKMTSTQPSISYSVNPDSVVENNPTSRSDNSDLNVDFSWYYNYFINTFDMDKLQAQQQACSILISVKNYDKNVIDRWLAQQGFSRQPDIDEDRESVKEIDDDADPREYPSIPLRIARPPVTTLRSHRDIVLPNGKILPRGTIQKIVHPYPKAERVTPDPSYPFFDLY